jgi:DNA-binding NarL/FixJ family response regulator
LSRATVGTHVQSVLTKLVHSRLEAASFAACYHLLEDSSRRARD